MVRKKKGLMPPANESLPQEPVPNTETSSGSFKRKPWLLIAIIILAIAGAGYWLVKNDGANKPTTKSPAQTIANQAAVSITSSGFEPATITVSVGSQVTWTNKDNKPHQVAAGPYPKNNSIEGFNSTIVLQENESYSFRFTKRGTYHVHDQMKPLKNTATVVVN